MNYYILLGLNRREYKIMNIIKEKEIIEVELNSKKCKVRCPKCNKFTSSIHSKLKPIRSVYLDSCVNVNIELDKNVNLEIGQFCTNSFFIK